MLCPSCGVINLKAPGIAPGAFLLLFVPGCFDNLQTCLHLWMSA